MTDGWKLTEAGVEWIRSNQASLETIAGAPVPKDHRQKSRRLLKRVRDHGLFADFQDDPSGFDPGIGQLAQLARCSVSADSSVWVTRFERLKLLGIETEQRDVVRFVDACVAAYERTRR